MLSQHFLWIVSAQREPPTGSNTNQLETTYRDLGRFIVQRSVQPEPNARRQAPAKAFVVSANPRLMSCIQMRARNRIFMESGGIATTLYEFDVFGLNSPANRNIQSTAAASSKSKTEAIKAANAEAIKAKTEAAKAKAKAEAAKAKARAKAEEAASRINPLDRHR